MSDTTMVCWREALRACVRSGEAVGLAEHLARLPEDERAVLLEGLECEELRARVNSLLLLRQEQLALA